MYHDYYFVSHILIFYIKNNDFENTNNNNPFILKLSIISLYRQNTKTLQLRVYLKEIYVCLFYWSKIKFYLKLSKNRHDGNYFS